MQKLLQLTAVVSITILAACRKTDNTPSTPAPSGKTVQAAISTSLSGADTLSSFAAAFGNVTLTDADVSQGVTVFAPVNKAFTAAAATASIGNRVITFGVSGGKNVVNGFTLPDTSNPNDYIVKGNITLSSLSNGATLTALSGYTLTLTLVNGNWYLNGVLISGTSVASGPNYLVYSIAGLLKASKMLKLTGLSDTATFPGWLLTINGQNFDTSVANTVVKINGVQAMVHSATASQIVVTVPPNATSGTVSVTTKGTTLTSKQSVRIMQAIVSTLPQSVTTGRPISGIQGMAVDTNDNLYFTNDNYNGLLANGVFKFDKAGNPSFYTPKFPNPNGDGTYFSAEYNMLWALAVDNQNNVYFQSIGGDSAHQYKGIFKLNTQTPNIAEWWAGNTSTTGPYTGLKNTVTVSALSMKFDANGNLWVGDWAGLRKITLYNQVSIVADSVQFKAADPAVIKNPALYGLDIDAAGNIYLADGAQGNTRIWKRSANGTISVIAGNNNAIAKDGIGTNAQFGSPFGLVLDKRGNIYVCDNDYAHSTFLIRMINPRGVVTTIAGSSNPGYTSTDGIGTSATFNGMNVIAIDSKGVLYVGPDFGGVRKITIQ